MPAPFHKVAAAALLLLAAACAAQRPQPSPAAQALEAPAAMPTEQWYFWTDDGVRHYAYDVGQARGPGDTVIVLHGGWGAEHSYLVSPLRGLGDSVRLVFFDQRGSLRSPAPDSTVRLPRLVADLDHLRETLGLGQVTLVAHSMGGHLAYAYLAAHPQRVRGIVLVGATLPAPFTSGPNMRFVRQVWPDADSAALTAATNRFFQEYGQRALRVIEREGLLPDSLRNVPWDSLDLLSAHRDRDRTRTWRITFAAVNSCSPERWREMEGGMAYYSQRAANNIIGDTTYLQHADQFWPALQRFGGPVRVIIGTCDYVDVGPMIWPRVVAHLPNAEIEVVEGSGHSIWMDRPREFEEAVRRALRGIR